MSKKNIKAKVGLREKIFASLGKRLMYWRSKKIPKLLMNLSYREAIRLLVELHGDLPSALEAIFNLALEAGPDFLNEWVERGSVIFSKYVGDHGIWIKAGYYSFVGDHIKYMKYIPPETEGEPHRVVWRIDKCFLCSGIETDMSLPFPVTTDALRDHGWGTIIAGVFQATTRMINEYTGMEFTTKVRETKCLLRGDPYSEFVAEFYPIEKDEQTT
ncbi:MAG: hypothetical protein HWN65_01590 [Candidatus Helarchaeota archaeon]|nr:hypothetical protein [Candidatus Helarchaeota archaeon]